MRKQYHFRSSPDGLMAWDVDRLLVLVGDVPVETLPLSDITELDAPYWFDHGYQPTVRAIVDHLRLVKQADVSYPIVIDPDGRVMDGMHRVARALLDGMTSINAKRLPELPDPDYVDRAPDELPY